MSRAGRGRQTRRKGDASLSATIDGSPETGHPEEPGAVADFPPAFLLSRPRVTQMVMNALTRRLALVIAPPGYGKSTAVRQALASRRTIWHTVREGETGGQIGSLLLRQMEREDMSMGGPALHAAPIDDAVRAVAVAMTRTRAPAWVVIDGWDRGESTSVSLLIQGLVDQGPRTLRVVVTGTCRPNLSIAGAARRGGVAALAANDLLFTREEVRDYLAHYWGPEAAGNLAESVHRLSRGWPAGMALTVLASPLPPTTTPRVASIDPDPGEVRRMLETLTPEQRRILMISALLPEFTPELIAEVAGRAATPHIVAEMAERVAYVTSSAGIFSVVPALRSLLAGMADSDMPPGERRLILHAAAEYFDRQDKPGLAVSLFLEADDPNGACRTLDTMGIWGILLQDTARHMTWAHALRGRETGFGAPFVIARALSLGGDARGAARYYRVAIDRGGPDLTALDRLQILPELKGALTLCGDPAAARIDGELLAVVPDDPRSEVMHRLLVSKSHRAEGRLVEAEELLEETLPMLRDLEQGRFLSHWLNVLGEIQLVRGRYDHALRNLRAVVDMVGAVDTRDRVNNLQMLGRLHGLCGDFDLAEGRLGAALRGAECAGLGVDEFIIALDLCLIAVWSGRTDDAWRWLHRARVRAQSFGENLSVRQTLDHFAARIEWACGDPTKAAAGFLELARHPASLYQAPTHYCWPTLDAALALLRAGELRDARSLLDGVESRTRALGAAHQLTNALLLKAEVEGRRGSPSLEEARCTIRQTGYRFMPATDESIRRRLRLASVKGPHAPLTPASTPPTRLLEIKTMGAAAIVRDGIPVDDSIWYRCGRARQLFQLLLSQPTLSCSGDEIIEDLWPEADGIRGRERLHTTVSDLRRVLRRAGLDGAIRLQHQRGFYRLMLAEGVTVDHLRFAALADRGLQAVAAGDAAAAKEALAQAVALYAEPFLPDARYEHYADFMGERLHQQQARCLRSLAEMDSGDPPHALAWWRQAAWHDPYEEEIQKAYIEACMQTDHPVEAQKALTAFEHSMTTELSLALPAWAKRLRSSLSPASPRTIR